MARIIILDTNALNNSVVPFARPGQTPTYSQRCRHWISECERAGATILVPAITYYEARRELERRRAAAKLHRLQAFSFLRPDRFIPLNTAQLEKRRDCGVYPGIRVLQPLQLMRLTWM